MNVEGKRYVGGDFPVHLLTMGKLFNKRLVPCAFGIKIGLYFHNVETKKMSPAKSPIISGFFATQTAIFLCTKTQM